MIGHMKKDAHLGRNFLAGATGDAINVIRAIAGHNFHLLHTKLIRLIAFLVSLLAISAPTALMPALKLPAR